MAGAVAFVFGLCALSFAAGCVVTAIMLRASAPEEEVVRPPAEPAAPAPRPEQPELRLLVEDFSAKPIHRNPVVGLPALTALEPEPAPDPAFARVVDPPGPPTGDGRVELVEEVDELADEVPEQVDAGPLPDDDSAADGSVADGSVADDSAPDESVADDKVPFVSAEAARFFLAYAARRGSESLLDPEPVADPEAVSEVEQVALADSEPQVDDVEPDIPAAVERPTARFDHGGEASRDGKRREIKLELVPQPSEPETAPQAEPTPAAEASADEPETVFVSCSGLVTEAEPDSTPDLGPESAFGSDSTAEPVHLEAVVPEQGASPEPESVPAQQVLVPNDEFRKRYLRTFEAARRRSSY
jgi:hypothetical protein